jgi:hypothetical protein
MVAAMVPVVGALAAPAMAGEPTKEFAVFKQCPRFSGVFLCMYSETQSGEVVLNKQAVPIVKTIVLQGGIKINPETGAESFVGALNGETLTKAAQKVPGGLLDLVNCTLIKGEGILEKLERGACEVVFENGTTGVNAITELAKPASEIAINTSNLEEREGVALSLPVKVRLENTLLGSECYIGSSSQPIVLALTDGTTNPKAPNKPITGKFGKVGLKDGGEFIEVTGNQLVNNEFAVPQASGCGGIFSFLLDPIIDSKIGLTEKEAYGKAEGSADGHNTAIQNNYIREASAEAVILSE